MLYSFLVTFSTLQSLGRRGWGPVTGPCSPSQHLLLDLSPVLCAVTGTEVEEMRAVPPGPRLGSKRPRASRAAAVTGAPGSAVLRCLLGCYGIRPELVNEGWTCSRCTAHAWTAVTHPCSWGGTLRAVQLHGGARPGPWACPIPQSDPGLATSPPRALVSSPWQWGWSPTHSWPLPLVTASLKCKDRKTGWTRPQSNMGAAFPSAPLTMGLPVPCRSAACATSGEELCR